MRPPKSSDKNFTPWRELPLPEQVEHWRRLSRKHEAEIRAIERAATEAMPAESDPEFSVWLPTVRRGFVFRRNRALRIVRLQGPGISAVLDIETARRLATRILQACEPYSPQQQPTQPREVTNDDNPE